jgi:hypothetical protein
MESIAMHTRKVSKIQKNTKNGIAPTEERTGNSIRNTRAPGTITVATDIPVIGVTLPTGIRDILRMHGTAAE